MDACPHCGAPVAAYGVYKHRWWVCGGCGSATREARPVLLADRLPAGLRRRLPARLRRDPAVAAAPGTAFFAQPDAEAGAAELRDVRGCLSAAGLPATGRILDVGGGPGFVAAGLAPAARVTLLEHSPAAVAHARALGVDAHPYDFRGAPIAAVAPGPFDLVLVRYAIAWCADLPAFAAQLTPVTRPGAALLVTFVLPTRGACLGSALEDAAPAVLWSEAALLAGFAPEGWRLAHRFAPAPPLPFAAPHRRGFAPASWPWALAPGPLPHELRQLHAGVVLRRPE